MIVADISFVEKLPNCWLSKKFSG